MAIFGAFLSDSYLGRFRVIALGSISSLLGMILLWLTSMVPEAKPIPCDSSLNICESPTLGQFAFLLFSLGLMSIGAGCIRPCSIAFGADQLVQKDNPEKTEVILQTYFNWYYASIGISTILALTVIVYIQDHMGWQVGFAVPVILMFLSTLFFFLGNSFYVKVKASTSLFTGFARVFVAAWKNRHLDLALQPTNSDGFYYHSKDSQLAGPSDKLRCLNKACIIRDPEEDLKPDGSASKPWELCSVDQVENLKSLIRIIPIWSTGIIIYVTLTQTSITVLQARNMDRHVTSNFEIPAGSFSLFTIATLTIWVAFYDRVVVPILAKYTGKPNGISSTVRMGIGLLLSCVAMAVGAIVENFRRENSIEEGFLISALWLVPQFCLIGLAEAFNAIGQIEFYYSQLPKSMASIAVAFFTLGTAFSSLLGGFIISVVDSVTRSGDTNESWVSKDPNKGHYDYYYWFLTFLSVLNFLYFVACCWFYGPYEERITRVSHERDELKEGLLKKSRDLPSCSSA
ncbi:Proton-dependent oligopeptide transporter family [Macleaya cordata]|uniref:Proton-dependent oligopeptide transporter family n=1 Tax=Macleaya cordata TaxID=56857 RepID=A0A200QDF7_MACCD|nr:Proton-dependent oligopeptide transporter family [Macleaya cordata]